MTVVTTETDDKILSIWKMEMFNAFPEAKLEVMKDEPNSIGDLFNKLEQFNDDILYTLPVHIVHSTGFIDKLKEMDFIGFKQDNSPAMTSAFFAVTHEGILKIIDMYNNKFKVDRSLTLDMNISNLVLNALGDKVEVIYDNNILLKSLDRDLKGKGEIATFCGPNVVMQVITEAKLNIYDTVSHIMSTVASDYKQVQYR